MNQPYSIHQRIAMVNKLMQPNFSAKAMAEYWDARNADVQQFMSMVQELDDYAIDVDNGSATESQVANLLAMKATELMQAKGWDVRGTFQTAYGTTDMLEYLVSAASDDASSVQVRDGIGHTTERTVLDVGQQLVDDLTSGIATAAFLRNVGDNLSVADRITAFAGEVESQLSPSVAQCNATVSYFKRLLQSKPSVQEAMVHLSTVLSLQDNANDQSSVVPGDSEFYNFTGASPVSMLNFDPNWTSLGNVFKAGGLMLLNLVASIAQGTEWLISQGKQYMDETFINPVDLVKISDQGDGVIAGWCHNAERMSSGDPRSYFGDAGVLNLTNDNKLNIISKWNAHPYRCFKAFWGVYQSSIILYSIDSQELTDEHGNVSGTRIQFMPSGVTNQPGSMSKSSFSPAVFNVTALYDLAVSRYGYESQWTINEDFIDGVLVPFLQSGQWNDTSTLSEEEMAQSLAWALHFARELDKFVQDGQPRVVKIPQLVYSEYMAGGTITNADFVYLASGYEYDSQSQTWSRPETEYSLIGDGFYFLAMYQELIRVLNPLEWPFIAYSSSADNVIQASWRIKTNAENQAAAQSFLNTAIIVIAAVAVTIAAGALGKRIARKLAWRREHIIATTQSKMWNGQALTAQEMKQYQRAVKKGGVSSLFANAQGATNPSGVDVGSVGDRLSQMISGRSL